VTRCRGQLWLRVLKVALPPLALVLSVLGSIIGGIAAPTEAASMARWVRSWWWRWRAGCRWRYCAT